MTEPILTVAIPTYMRIPNLKLLLEQFSTQYDPRFTILIADDYPQDSAEMLKMVSEFKDKLPNIRLIINDKNLGYSENVCSLYEQATTKYIWFLCDDDTVKSDSIKLILAKLEKYSPSVAIFNYTWFDSYGVFGTAGVSSDKAYLSINDVTDYNVLMRITFLSNLVMERLVPTQEIKSQNFKDNVFFQITLGLQILSRKMCLYECSDTVLHRNVGYKYGEFIKFYLLDHLKAIYILPHAFDNSKFREWSIKHLFNAFKLYMSQKIGLFVYKGSPTPDTLKTLKEYYGNYYYLVRAFSPIYNITPAILVKGFYLGTIVLKHGFSKAWNVYTENSNRVNSDTRRTSFTEYK